MFKRTVTPEDLAHLGRLRQEADAKYNEVLTTVDQVKLPRLEMPHPPPAFDEHQITRLNELWDPLADVPKREGGWRGRVQAFIWDLVAPVFERQRTFNSTLVDHINRNVPVHRATRPALETTIWALGAHTSVAFTSHDLLLDLLQKIAPYVESRDRDIIGFVRRLVEDCQEIIDILDHRTVGLTAGLGGVSDELLKRWESMVARERRYESRVSALAAGQERSMSEFQTALGVLQKSTHVLRREMERIAEGAPARAADATRGARPPAPPPPRRRPRGEPASRLGLRQLQVRGLRGPVPRRDRRHSRALH